MENQKDGYVNMETFVTDCEFKTPSMKVKVFGSDKILKREYDTPPGFRLEMYVTSLYPESMLTIRFILGDFCVDVYGGENNSVFLERHLGKYEKDDSQVN